MRSYEKPLTECDGPLVSIIVPAYNAEDYLDRCLASIARQTYRCIEVIVVNDGSTDRTPAICARWQSEDPRIVTLEKVNSGLPAARNTGLRAASGSWVLFVDSDDELLPIAVEKLIEYCDDADIVSFGWIIESENGRVTGEQVPRQFSLGNEKDLISEIAKGYLADYIWSYMFRKKAILLPVNNSGPFAEGRTLFEDSISLQRLLRVRDFKVTFLPQALYIYRQTKSSMSRKKDAASARAGIDAVKELEGYTIDDGLRDYWLAKLMKMLLLGADQVAGSGLGDGNTLLHREIYSEICRLSSLGGRRALSQRERARFLLFRLHLYRPLRRVIRTIRMLGESPHRRGCSCF